MARQQKKQDRIFADDMGNPFCRFRIEGIYFGNHTFPGLNDYLSACGKNPRAGGRMKADAMKVAIICIQSQLRGVHIQSPCYIHYDFYDPDAKRDHSNVASFAIKVIEDALQKCKVLINDSPKYVKGYSQSFYIDKTRPRIEVTISWIKDG